MGMLSRFSMDKQSISLLNDENVMKMEAIFDEYNQIVVERKINDLKEVITEEWKDLNQYFKDKDIDLIAKISNKIVNHNKDLEEVIKNKCCYGCFSFLEFKEVLDRLKKDGYTYDYWYDYYDHLIMFSKILPEEKITLSVITEDTRSNTITVFENGKYNTTELIYNDR